MAEPASPPSLPPTQLLPDAEAWLTANNLNEFLPFLREAGFTDIDSISTITESDAEAIGISQLGARRRLVRAIQRLAATLPPSPFPHPHLNSTPPRAGQPGGSTSPYAGQPLSLRLSSPDDATEDDGTPSKKKRGPMRCGKCHQWKKMCHGHCTVRCTSFATCPTRHRRAHPELKEEEKEQRRKEEEERKRKREEEKEEKRREKKVRHEEETLTTSPGGVVPGESSAPGVMMLDNGERLVLLDKDVAEAASEIVAASLQHHHHHQQQQQHQLQQQHHQQQQHEHQQLPPPQQQHPQLHINLHPVV